MLSIGELATINGWPPFPSYLPASVWLLAALRAHP